MKKALTLLQAEKAEVRGIRHLKAHEACVSILNASHALRVRALHDCTQDAVINAEAMKTTKGKANKYAKLLHSLEAHENVFIGMEEYTTVYNKVKARIFELIGGNAGE